MIFKDFHQILHQLVFNVGLVRTSRTPLATGMRKPLGICIVEKLQYQYGSEQFFLRLLYIPLGTQLSSLKIPELLFVVPATQTRQSVSKHYVKIVEL